MKFLAIDGNSILHRAYHGIKMLTNKDGVPTNAIFGFMNIYLKNFSKIKPDAAAVAFDVKEPTFRHKAVASYKANRHAMDNELAQQFPLIKQILEAMGVKIVECAGWEADDILGTLSELCTENGDNCYILTGDRDSLQLVDKNTTVILATNKDDIFYTPELFREEYGFEPINLIDYKALMGDTSDNISGVAGVGKKTASDLVKTYATIEKIYQEYENSSLTKGMKAKLASGESAAKESKWLATIVRNVPIEKNLESYKLKEPNNAEISRLLTELEMYKLLERMNISLSEGNTQEEEYTAVNVKESPLTADIIKGLKAASYIFDGSKLCVRDGENVYFSEDIPVIRTFMESECEKETISAKPHYRWALANDCELVNLRTDAGICGYLLNPAASEYDTEKLCAEYGVHYYSENGDFAELLSIKRLSEKLREEIQKEGMTFLLDSIEMPLIEVLASMEHTGIKIQEESVKDFGTMLSEKIEETQQMIFDDVGHKFNISSSRQVGEVLFDELKLPSGRKTKSGYYSTDAEVLEEIRNLSPVVDNILKYRQYTKLKSTYVVGLLEKISDDGKIHTCFKQTETRTGRISSTEPNMQNIPTKTELGSQMRKFFTADEGKILVDADYSQIELRVMAALCNDKNMINAFESGEDIHTSTASQVFDMPSIMVTSEMRSAAKAVNFGIIFGIGAYSLSKDINVSVAEAQRYIDDYLAKYPNVDKFMKETVENAIKTGEVRTLLGRKRKIPEIMSSNRKIQAAGKRIAMNTPVQGTAADLIKIAMINVYKRLKAEELNAKLILQVHDELIIESDISCADRCAEVLKEEMMNVYDMKVPLVVDVNKGHSWYDAKS